MDNWPLLTHTTKTSFCSQNDMSPEIPTARLRRVFRFMRSDDDDGGLQEMDDQQQEQLIEELRRRNETTNARYTLIFTFLPILASLVYIPGVFSSSLDNFQSLLFVLAIASFLATSYTMRFYPMRKPDLKGKRPLKVVYAENTFTRRYIRYINGSVGGLVAISGLSYADSEASRTLFWLQCLLPLVMFVIATIAQRAMIDVDIRELEALRYDYKGA